jgi:hypothetical protein
MRQYGTAGVFFEKTAGAMPFAARLAGALFSGAMVRSAGREMDHQRLEAHQMNEQFRLLEEREMLPAKQNLQHTRAPMFLSANSDVPVGWDEGMVRLASIVQDSTAELIKRADGMPPMRPMVQSDPFKKHPPLPARAGGAAAPTNYLAGMPGPKPTALPTTGAPPPVRPPPTQMNRAPTSVLSGGGGAPKLTPPNVAKFTAPAAKGPGMMQSMLGANWKSKALGFGALAGGGYLALKGLNKGLGAMSREAPPQNWGGPGTALPMGVNEYGEPQMGTPIMR